MRLLSTLKISYLNPHESTVSTHDCRGPHGTRFSVSRVEVETPIPLKRLWVRSETEDMTKFVKLGYVENISTLFFSNRTGRIIPNFYIFAITTSMIILQWTGRAKQFLLPIPGCELK